MFHVQKLKSFRESLKLTDQLTWDESGGNPACSMLDFNIEANG